MWSIDPAVELACERSPLGQRGHMAQARVKGAVREREVDQTYMYMQVSK